MIIATYTNASSAKESLRGYTIVTAQNLGDFWDFFLKKSIQITLFILINNFIYLSRKSPSK